jgi:hypothetical protein
VEGEMPAMEIVIIVVVGLFIGLVIFGAISDSIA